MRERLPWQTRSCRCWRLQCGPRQEDGALDSSQTAEAGRYVGRHCFNNVQIATLYLYRANRPRLNKIGSHWLKCFSITVEGTENVENVVWASCTLALTWRFRPSRVALEFKSFSFSSQRCLQGAVTTERGGVHKCKCAWIYAHACALTCWQVGVWYIVALIACGGGERFPLHLFSLHIQHGQLYLVKQGYFTTDLWAVFL